MYKLPAVLGAGGLYLIQGADFSRLLLFMLVIANIMAILFNRTVFSKIGNKLFEHYLNLIPLLMLGNGNTN